MAWGTAGRLLVARCVGSAAYWRLCPGRPASRAVGCARVPRAAKVAYERHDCLTSWRARTHVSAKRSPSRKVMKYALEAVVQRTTSGQSHGQRVSGAPETTSVILPP